MNRTILISLSGHADQFQLDEAAYNRLNAYLDGSSSRLRDEADRAEVLSDLERSIGDRLVALDGARGRLITLADISPVLDDIGPVDTGADGVAAPTSETPHGARRRRRLYRVREGQEIAGVCTGLAAYSEIDVDWVRTIFILGSLVTAGILIVVYIGMAFALPIEDRYVNDPR